MATAVSHLGEGVLITSDDLEWPGPHIVFVNEAMCRITGYTADELIGQSPRVLQGDGTDRETLDRIKAELSAGRPCEAEIANYRKDGTPYDAELFITPLFNAEGHRTNFVSIHRDISERKQAEEAFQRAEALQRNTLENISDAVFLTDDAGQFKYVCPNTNIIFGYDDAEVREMGHISRVLGDDVFDPDHLERSGEVRNIERAVQDRDGHKHDLLVNVRRVSINGGTRLYVCRDVTDINLAGEALRREHEFAESLTDTAPTIVLVLDTEGRIRRFNPYMEELTGWHLDEVQGRDWFDTFLPENYREQIRSLFGRAISGERTRGNVSAILTKDGRERDIEWYDAPLTNSEGELIGLLCTGLDVTERRLLEREVLEIAAEEDRRIGHELHDSTQQQLTGLGLLAQDVAEGLQQLNEAATASDRLGNAVPLDRLEELQQRAMQIQTGLSSAVHEVSRLSHGLIPVELDAEGLMSSLTELARNISDVQSVACVFRCDGPVAVASNFTATHLYRIAQEAVNNALKHSGADRIEISLSELDRVLTLKIVDNGRGIEEKRGGGLGMGLRIMSYRADMIGATLTVLQTEGGGTEVACSVTQP